MIDQKLGSSHIVLAVRERKTYRMYRVSSGRHNGPLRDYPGLKVQTLDQKLVIRTRPTLKKRN